MKRAAASGGGPNRAGTGTRRCWRTSPTAAALISKHPSRRSLSARIRIYLICFPVEAASLRQDPPSPRGIPTPAVVTSRRAAATPNSEGLRNRMTRWRAACGFPTFEKFPAALHPPGEAARLISPSQTRFSRPLHKTRDDTAPFWRRSAPWRGLSPHASTGGRRR